MSNLRSNDRVLVLKPMEGKDPISTGGLVDRRLFSGENNLHIILDRQTCLWNCKFDSGVLPQPLKQRFTSFDRAKDFVQEYYKKRNIEIAQVID